MTSDDRLSLILRRLDEIERKLDHMLEELRRHGEAIVQARIEVCPTLG
jgi:tetrahydromethanopterin S-methyltransferase subunit G